MIGEKTAVVVRPFDAIRDARRCGSASSSSRISIATLNHRGRPAMPSSETTLRIWLRSVPRTTAASHGAVRSAGGRVCLRCGNHTRRIARRSEAVCLDSRHLCETAAPRCGRGEHAHSRSGTLRAWRRGGSSAPGSTGRKRPRPQLLWKARIPRLLPRVDEVARVVAASPLRHLRGRRGGERRLLRAHPLQERAAATTTSPS